MGATEIWYDGTDQDCDGGDDFDQDEDGFHSDQYGGTDCDDTNPLINPSATDDTVDGIDDDCDGSADEDELDADGDGVRPSEGDCDDTDPSINPNATGNGTTVPIKTAMVPTTLTKMGMAMTQTNMAGLTVMIPVLRFMLVPTTYSMMVLMPTAMAIQTMTKI